MEGSFHLFSPVLVMVEWSKQKVIEELIKQSEDGIAPSAEKGELYDNANTYFGSWEEAVHEAGLNTRSEGRIEWTRQKVIDKLKEHADGDTAPSSSEHQKLSYAVRKFFDSWNAGCQAAGLIPRGKNKWSKQKIIEELKKKADGKFAPSSADYPNLYNTAIRYFSSWTEAIKEAGLLPRDEKGNTEEELIRELKERSEDGIAPRTSEHHDLLGRVLKRFDSWQQACDKAGVTSRNDIQSRETDVYLERLREASKDGIAPSSEQFKHHSVLVKRFGSWEKACEAAGVEPRGGKKWTRKRVLEQLKEDAAEGVAPSTHEVTYDEAARREFGSWQTACEAAGVMSRSEYLGWDSERHISKWNRERIIERIEEDAEDGIAPASPHYRTIAERYFDGWEEACRAAGVKPRASLSEWTEEEIIEQIKKDAEEGVAPSSIDTSYKGAAAAKFGSWKEACHAAGVRTRKEAEGWNREKIIKELRNISDGRMAPSAKEHKSLHSLVTSYFSGWKEACRSAGLIPKSDRNKWTQEKVIEEIRKRSEGGVAPSTAARQHQNLYVMAKNVFSSWEEACREAGVKTRREEKMYTKEEVIEEIRELSEDGIAPSTGDQSSLRTLAGKYFDSWEEACREAGVQSRGEASPPRKWTREKIIQRIQELSEDGIAPGTKEIGCEGAMRREFDSWEEACQEAGVTPRSELPTPVRIPDEQIIQRIRETSEDGIATSSDQKSLAALARKRFGSWKKACEKAGVTPRSEAYVPKKWTNERIMNEIREHSEEGVAPGTQDHGSLAQAARKMYGSWKKACEKAGVTPRSELK